MLTVSFTDRNGVSVYMTDLVKIDIKQGDKDYQRLAADFNGKRVKVASKLLDEIGMKGMVMVILQERILDLPGMIEINTRHLVKIN